MGREREGWKLHLQSILKENLRNAGTKTKIIRKPALIYIFVLKNYKIGMTEETALYNYSYFKKHKASSELYSIFSLINPAPILRKNQSAMPCITHASPSQSTTKYTVALPNKLCESS